MATRKVKSYFFLHSVFMLTGGFEEICQIYRKSAAVIFTESDGMQQLFSNDGTIAVEKGGMNVAQINKIEGCAAQYKQRLLVRFLSFDGGKVINAATFGKQCKLADSDRNIIDSYTITEKVGIICDIAVCTQCGLFFLGLNGIYFQHGLLLLFWRFGDADLQPLRGFRFFLIWFLC